MGGEFCTRPILMSASGSRSFDLGWLALYLSFKNWNQALYSGHFYFDWVWKQINKIS